MKFRLEVHAIDGIGERLYEAQVGRPKIATRGHVRQLLTEVTAGKGKGTQRFGPRFLLGEWEDVMDAWQLKTWEDYRDVKRLGRKTRLSEQQRFASWEVFEIVKRRLGEQGLVTRAQMFSQLAEETPEPPESTVRLCRGR